MDVSDYLPMFVAEAREHLQELNLALVRLEETPGDRSILDEIFRIAHSVKGMSATMGFEAMAALTHEMEDVLEGLRTRDTLAAGLVDVLLACLDALSDSVEAIDGGGEEGLDATVLIARLREVAGEDAPDAAPEPPAQLTEPGRPAASGDAPTLRITIDLASDASMPGVRTFQALNALTELGELLDSSPALADAASFDGRRIDATVRTTSEPGVVITALRGVPEVADAEVLAPPAPAAVPAADKGGSGSGHGGGSSTVRVDADRLDQLLHHMGELVLHRTRLEGIASGADLPELSHAIQGLTRTSQALQAMVMQIRMMPVQSVFVRFPRLVRDLSAKLGKQVDLQLLGGETELDRTVIDALGDPLMHLIRNAVDHGLEAPEDREAAGKPATGTLTLSAAHAGGNVVITVADDGRGVDAAKVQARAEERGLLAPGSPPIDDAQAIEFLFAAGFSTATVTSDISGRGVGMDAVRNTVRDLGGEVVMTSVPGKGTSATVRLPLTLAIMAALVVETGGEPLAIPLDRVESTLRLDEQVVRTVAGSPMLVLRDGVLPVVDAGRFSRGVVDDADAPYAVVVRAGAKRVAIRVSGLVGQRELVTRPLPPEAGDGRGLSGAAVLADGDIALILDCDELQPSVLVPA